MKTLNALASELLARLPSITGEEQRLGLEIKQGRIIGLGGLAVWLAHGGVLRS